MAHLVDSSLLIRHTNPSDADFLVAANAIDRLHEQGERLRSTPQVFIEFRNVATRPAEVNGLDLSIADAEARASIYEATFPLLPETPEIFAAWKSLVQAAGVTSKQVHDARLVAICHADGVSHILTFSVRHFARLAAFGPGVTIVDPNEIG